MSFFSKIKSPGTALFSLFLSATVAVADEPVVENVSVVQSGGSWTVSVTLSHPDTGWDHYADGWRVLDGNGNVLGTRVLHHPHVHEQPFTRSLGGIQVPSDLSRIFVQARCNVDGWARDQYEVQLK